MESLFPQYLAGARSQSNPIYFEFALNFVSTVIGEKNLKAIVIDTHYPNLWQLVMRHLLCWFLKTIMSIGWAWLLMKIGPHLVSSQFTPQEVMSCRHQRCKKVMVLKNLIKKVTRVKVAQKLKSLMKIKLLPHKNIKDGLLKGFVTSMSYAIIYSMSIIWTLERNLKMILCLIVMLYGN